MVRKHSKTISIISNLILSLEEFPYVEEYDLKDDLASVGVEEKRRVDNIGESHHLLFSEPLRRDIVCQPSQQLTATGNISVNYLHKISNHKIHT